jgi:hypothetical protein
MMDAAVYTDTELRAWLRRHIKRGVGQHMGPHKAAAHEFPTMAFCRMIRWDQRDLNQWLNESTRLKRTMPPEVRRRMVQFIGLWDAGLLDVEFGGKYGMKKEIVRRSEAKRMPLVMKVSVSVGTHFPKLAFVPKRPAPLAQPGLRKTGNVLDRLRAS